MVKKSIIEIMANEKLKNINDDIIEIIHRGKFLSNRLNDSSFHEFHQEISKEKTQQLELLNSILEKNSNIISEIEKSIIHKEFDKIN